MQELSSEAIHGTKAGEYIRDMVIIWSLHK